MRGVKSKLTFMTIISLPLLFHLLLVSATLFAGDGNDTEPAKKLKQQQSREHARDHSTQL